MTVKIIQVNDGGADEFNSVDEWVRCCRSSGAPVGVWLRDEMLRVIDAMPSGTMANFGGGWVLKDVKEVEFK